MCGETEVFSFSALCHIPTFIIDSYCACGGQDTIRGAAPGGFGILEVLQEHVCSSFQCLPCIGLDLVWYILTRSYTNKQIFFYAAYLHSISAMRLKLNAILFTTSTCFLGLTASNVLFSQDPCRTPKGHDIGPCNSKVSDGPPDQGLPLQALPQLGLIADSIATTHVSLAHKDLLFNRQAVVATVQTLIAVQQLAVATTHVVTDIVGVLNSPLPVTSQNPPAPQFIATTKTIIAGQ